jgi:quercetin dioxygenase-like cupin family protein
MIKGQSMYKLFIGLLILATLTGCNATDHSSQTGSFGEYSSADGGEVVVEQLLKTQTSWNGDTLPNYPDTPSEITVLRVVVPPHTKLDWHQHPVINAAVLLKGTLTVYTQSNQVLKFKTGEATTELVDTWHYGANETDEAVELIVFYAGTPGTPITIKKPQN